MIRCLASFLPTPWRDLSCFGVFLSMSCFGIFFLNVHTRYTHTPSFPARADRSQKKNGVEGEGEGERVRRNLNTPIGHSSSLFFPPLGIGGKRPHVPTTYRMSQKKTTLQGVPEKTFTGCPRKKLLPVLAPLVPLSEIQL